MNRRTYLGTIGASVTALAGCTALGESNTTPSTQEPSDSGCSDNLQPLAINFEEDYNVRHGTAHGFELTASPETVSRGRLTFRLENTTNQVQTTPNKELFAIQKRIDGAWKHLFYVDESHGYDANAVVHEPGGGFKWSFSVTRGCHRKRHTRRRRMLELCLRAPASCKRRLLSTSSSM